MSHFLTPTHEDMSKHNLGQNLNYNNCIVGHQKLISTMMEENM